MKRVHLKPDHRQPFFIRQEGFDAWMEPDKPPMESTGACDNTVLLEGRFLQQKCTGDMMGQPFTGIGVHGYDNATKKYVTTWIDSMGASLIPRSKASRARSAIFRAFSWTS